MSDLSQGQGGQLPGTGEPSGQGSGDASEYSLAPDFLQRVPDAERPIVERYVKDWDAGVTRKFQELHGQVKPWNELGTTPEEAGQALAIMRALDENPMVIYQLLNDHLTQSGQLQQQQQQQPAQQQPQYGQPPLEQFQPPVGPPGSFQPQGYPGQFTQQPGQLPPGVPPEIAGRLDQQQQVIESMANWVLAQNAAAQAAQEDQQLDSLLTEAKTKHGDFDEDYVLTKMYNGVPIEQAIQSYQQLVQAQVNASHTPGQRIPPLLGGGGNAPVEQQKKLGELSNNDVKSLVASALAQANQ